MIGFKGFDKELKCRGKQYAIGETAEEPEAKLCKSGIHFCEYPLDTFNYYAPGAGSRYCQVESADKDLSPETENVDTKRVTSRLKIGFELSLPAIIAAAVKFTFDRATWTDADKTTGYREAASATGDRGAALATGYSGAALATGDSGAASATGYSGAASATGYSGAALATGDSGAASATGYSGAALATGYRGAALAIGDSGAASATGYSGAASATGYSGAASATGYRGAALATGYSGAASATGDRGAAFAGGKESVACALGYCCTASGTLGNWLVLAERDGCKKILNIKSIKVDGETIKENVFYKLENDQIVEE